MLQTFIMVVLVNIKTHVMLRFFFCLCLSIFSTLGFAEGAHHVQVDLIIFTHAYTEKNQMETSAQPIPQDIQTAIPLQPREVGAHGSYQLIATSHSNLQSLWSRLNHHSQYQPLFHYTWIQPAHNQKAVLLPANTSQGWTVQGTVRVRQSNYYLLDTALQFKALNSSASAFVLSQKMRLKPGNTYYLDHPQGGMLINVHRVS